MRGQSGAYANLGARGRALTKGPLKVTVALIERDGAAFAATTEQDPQESDRIVPLASLAPVEVALMPR